MTPETANRVMHANFKSPGVSFMASDGMPDKTYGEGPISLSGYDDRFWLKPQNACSTLWLPEETSKCRCRICFGARVSGCLPTSSELIGWSAAERRNALSS